MRLIFSTVEKVSYFVCSEQKLVRTANTCQGFGQGVHSICAILSYICFIKDDIF